MEVTEPTQEVPRRKVRGVHMFAMQHQHFIGIQIPMYDANTLLRAMYRKSYWLASRIEETPDFGRMTQKTTDEMLGALQNKDIFGAERMKSDSRFLDIGSGFGRTVFHTQLRLGKSAICVGIEPNESKHEGAVSILKYLNEEFPGFFENTRVENKDPTTMDTFNYTHIYMDSAEFDRKFKKSVYKILENSPRLKVLVCTDPPRKLFHYYRKQDLGMIHHTPIPAVSDDRVILYYYWKDPAGVVVEPSAEVMERVEPSTKVTVIKAAEPSPRVISEQQQEMIDLVYRGAFSVYGRMTRLSIGTMLIALKNKELFGEAILDETSRFLVIMSGYGRIVFTTQIVLGKNATCVGIEPDSTKYVGAMAILETFKSQSPDLFANTSFINEDPKAMDEFDFTHIFMDTSVHYEDKVAVYKILEKSPRLKVFVCTEAPDIFAASYGADDLVPVHQTKPTTSDYDFDIYYYLKKGGPPPVVISQQQYDMTDAVYRRSLWLPTKTEGWPFPGRMTRLASFKMLKALKNKNIFGGASPDATSRFLVIISGYGNIVFTTQIVLGQSATCVGIEPDKSHYDGAMEVLKTLTQKYPGVFDNTSFMNVDPKTMNEFDFTHIFMDTSVYYGDKVEVYKILEKSPRLKVFVCTETPDIFAASYGADDLVPVHQTKPPRDADYDFDIYYYLKKGASE